MRPRLNILLWILQCLLAALFLFAGVAKLNLPAAELAKQTGLPVPFMRFVSTAEILGALGLILPGLLRIQVILTPVAAACLVIVMIGATIVTLLAQPATHAILPALTGVLLCYVAYARLRLSPLRSRK